MQFEVLSFNGGMQCLILHPVLFALFSMLLFLSSLIFGGISFLLLECLKKLLVACYLVGEKKQQNQSIS
jgi:hypothetical protein